MKKIYLILLLISCFTGIIFAQKQSSLIVSVDSVHGQDSAKVDEDDFYIGISFNHTIPTVSSFLINRVYIRAPEYDINGKYYPQATFSMGVKSGYEISLTNNNNKMKFALIPEILFNYYKDKYLRNYYNTKSKTNTIFYNLSLNLLPTITYSFNKKTSIYFYAGIGIGYSFNIIRNVALYDANNNIIKVKEYNFGINGKQSIFTGNFISRIAYFRKNNNHSYGVFAGILFFPLAPSPLNYYIKTKFILNKVTISYGLMYKF